MWSAEQLDRGLAGAIVVADRSEPAVGRDLLWVLDDWRLDARGEVHESFGNLHDASPFTRWRDTVLVWPRERVRVAFVADNPGRWMIHCHIPEHQEAGMMGVVQVG